MERLWSALGDFKDPRLDTCDSFGDKLSCKHTVFLLFLFSIALTVKQHYVGDPIQCWHPDHFRKSHVKYTQQLCWINNTYYLSFNQTQIPKAGEPRTFIGYYQWTSIILSCQAVLFYLPRMLWMTFNKKSGMEVTTITGASWDCLQTQDNVSREKILRYMANHMNRFLSEVRGKIEMSNKLAGFWWMFYGSFLAFLYLGIKILYLLNAAVQLVALEHLLGLRHHLHGLDFIRKLFSESAGVESPLFPRIAYCDFKVRYLGNVLDYTVQCSLPINLFNEKIFLLVWFWLIFMVVTTTLSLAVWLWRYLYMRGNVNWVKGRLFAMDTGFDNPPKDFSVFVKHYLRRDGIFIMYLVSINSSDFVASELLVELWKLFQSHKMKAKFEAEASIQMEDDYSPDTTPLAEKRRTFQKGNHIK